MYRVGVLHSHPLIAWAVDRALATVPDIEVSILDGWRAGPAAGQPARGALDVLITDRAPEPAVVADRPAVASYVLLMSAGEQEQGAEPAGVDGLLSEYSRPSEIVSAVHRAVARRSSPADAAAGAATELSRRELQVLGFIADGLTHAQTAGRLGISPHTVDTYVKRIKSKLGAGNKADLARLAVGLCWT